MNSVNLWKLQPHLGSGEDRRGVGGGRWGLGAYLPINTSNNTYTKIISFYLSLQK